MRRLPPVVVCALLAAAAYGGEEKKKDPSQIGNRDVGRGVNFYSLEKEIALGRQLAREVRRQARMVEDPIITEYVNRLGQNLARNSDAKVPFTFEVVDDATPNAFAFPGGFVFVNSGLIEIADEEDELAGALAHEIAHVAARHMTRQATKEQLARLATVPLVLVAGGIAAQGAGIAIPMTMLSFSRGDEIEADYLGVQYMYAAGYDPTGAIGIFEKLELLRRATPAGNRMLSTHPRDEDRIAKAQREIQEILPAKAQYIVSTSEYRDVRRRLIDLGTEAPALRARPTLQKAPGSGNTAETPDPTTRPKLERRK